MPRRHHSLLRHALAALAILTTVVAGAMVVAPAHAATASDFNAGYIISDQNFFDAGSMTEADIQNFLQSVACKPRDSSPCLRSYTQSTSTVAAVVGRCSQYTGAASEPASRIIAKVSQACGISPKVLLVLLQKEQTLLTSPNSYGYTRATGYACPDTAACDTKYFGFFNQLYSAAKQFKAYGANPGSWRYHPGNVAVQYNPNAGCGAPVINIRNQATADLYNYTPYQPNAAALGNLYGLGDGCSAYGNRNFWRIYTDWFGNPIGDSALPVGYLDSATTEGRSDAWGSIRVRGWAVDKFATASSVPVRVQTDDRAGTIRSFNLTANSSRPDVDAAFHYGAQHGYETAVPIFSPAIYTVCVFATGVSGPSGGKSGSLGCTTVDARTPGGWVDSATIAQTSSSATLSVRGWDADWSAPTTALPTHIYLTDPNGNTQVVKTVADRARSDVAAAFPSAGASHGFSVDVPITAKGRYSACVYALGQSSLNKDKNPMIGCVAASTDAQAPTGMASAFMDGYGSSPQVTVSGTGFDPALPGSSIAVHTYLTDPKGTVTKLVASTDGKTGAFSQSLAIKGIGTYQACSFALGASFFNKDVNPAIGCSAVQVTTQSPSGYLDPMTGSGSTLSVKGWAFDTSARAISIPVHLYVTSPDGSVSKVVTTANTTRVDVGKAFPRTGDNHGFEVSIPLSTRGSYKVCAYALGQTVLSKDINPQVGCSTFSN